MRHPEKTATSLVTKIFPIKKPHPRTPSSPPVPRCGLIKICPMQCFCRMLAWKKLRNSKQRCIWKEDKSWLARHNPRSRLWEWRGQPRNLKWQPSLRVDYAMSGIVHTREQEKTLGFSPGVPPCRELLSSKSPMSKHCCLLVPLARAFSLTGLPGFKEWSRGLKCFYLVYPHCLPWSDKWVWKEKKQESKKEGREREKSQQWSQTRSPQDRATAVKSQGPG